MTETLPQTNEDILFKMTGFIETDGMLSDVELANKAMEDMAVDVNTEFGLEKFYKAALPDYPGAFTRDGTIANQLRGDWIALASQVAYSANRIGKKMDPITGEEPGKAFHEFPGVMLDQGLSTMYNACDTSALLLHSIASITESNDGNFADSYTGLISECVNYIKRHTDSQGIFIEDPVFCGVNDPDGSKRRFALRVTYWKDSELNRSGNRAPHYPIIYTVAHFQNASALSRIGKIMGDERLTRQGRYMLEAGVAKLWKDDHFVTAVDMDGVIDPVSSDSLTSLLYIPDKIIGNDRAKKIESYMGRLETDAGYRSGLPVSPDIDMYHMNIWTHEQALLNAAARMHGLARAEDMTKRITPFIMPKDGLYPELVNPISFNPEGNMEQLWAMGAYIYFADPDKALL